MSCRFRQSMGFPAGVASGTGFAATDAPQASNAIAIAAASRGFILALLRRGRFRFERAQIDFDAAPAFGLSRLADVAAVQDQPMMSVLPERRRRDLFKLRLYLGDVFAGRQPGAVRNAEDMRVD